MCIEETNMQAQRLNITLPYELARDFKRAIPAKKRSKFIASFLKKNIPQKGNFKEEWIKSLKAQEKIIKEIREDFKYVDAEAFERMP